MTAAPHLQVVDGGADADPLIGTSLDGRYLIEDRLGEGGMGLVYRARHTVLDRALAIKVLKPAVSQDEKVIARFRREAQAASAIGSPHICDVSDFGTLPDGSTYFVMEMLDGPSLSAAMEGGVPLATPRLLHVAGQLADALGAAHAQGIVHRDLKPDNVHLVKHGNKTDFVKVLDFGIAKVGGGADAKLTQAGQVFGTPHYMSPEQCAGNEVDLRTDIYALGVMMYEMACGKVPFDADNLMGLLTKHVYEQPIPLRELPSSVDVSPGLEAVILKCLEKAPAARYPDMAALRADIDALAREGTPSALLASLDRLSGTGPGPRPDPSQAHLLPIPAEPRPGRRLAIGGALLVAVAAAAFGIAFSMGAFENAGPEPDASVGDTSAGDSSPDDVDSPQPETAQAPGHDGTDTDTDVQPDVAPDTAQPGPATAQVITVASEPPGAEVLGPNGVFLGNTPLQVDRPSGEASMELRIRLPGYNERAVVLGHRSQPALRLLLTPEAQASNRRRPPSAPTPRGEPAATPAPGPTPTPPATPPSEPLGPVPVAGDLMGFDE